MPPCKQNDCGQASVAWPPSRDGLSQELQIPEHRRGLMAERRERADQAQDDGTQKRAKCRSRRWARKPDECQIHDPRNNEPCRDRASRDAEQCCRRSEQQIFERVSADQLSTRG